MKSILRLGILSSFICLVLCQLDSDEASHIIKLKTAVPKSAANNIIMTHHREFLSSIRNLKPELQSVDKEYSAAALEKDFALEHIGIGDNFAAITGVFYDHAFLDYLYHQSVIDYVEENQIYSTTDVNDERKVMTGKSTSWGLARIRQHEKGNLEEYDFDTMGGNGVDVFVLDTGVFVEHSDFSGRASHAANMVKHEEPIDMGGHGTHVSGKIIGQQYGVAKGANVKSVKILNKNGDGSTSGLLKGIEYVIQNATPGKSLVNLSLSGPKSKLLDEALNTLVLEHNIPVFVSAGNAGTDACFFSPSSNPNVFSVGAIDVNDHVPQFSDVGECVAIYAPGADIVSSFIGGSDASKSMDGTSMASPHVAGIAANLMSKNQYTTAQQVYDAIKNIATKDSVVFDSSKSSSPNNNLLAFNEI